MIAIVNVTDITGIDLNSDWLIHEYDTNNIDGSSLASIIYTNTPPDFAIHLFDSAEYEQFKQSPVWKVAE
jgi:hypothetical protein